MLAMVVAFVASLLLTLVILKTQNLHLRLSSDPHATGVQKIHEYAVPRIGGLAIALSVFVGVVAASAYYKDAIQPKILLLLLAALPALGFGLAEDISKKVGPALRLVATMLSALFAAFLLDVLITRIDIELIDWMLQTKLTINWPYWDGLELLPFALVFTCILVAGLANAVNIIDGLNGLASMVVMMMFGSLAFVAFKVDDALILALSMVMIGAILGFFLFNYPAGLIFLGDGGAYFIGFMLGSATILLVMRNEEISVWYAVLLLIYPVWETIFSIYRRIFIKKQSASMPDAAHLHTLIFRRVMRWAVGYQGVRRLHLNNSMSSPFLWLLSAAAVIPATLLFRSSSHLLFFIGLFCFSYIWLYACVVRFKTPNFLKFFRKFNQ